MSYVEAKPNDPMAAQFYTVAARYVLKLKTLGVLHKYDLDSHYLDLVAKVDDEEIDPVELVQALYEDKSIIERSSVAAGRFPDINRYLDNQSVLIARIFY